MLARMKVALRRSVVALAVSALVALPASRRAAAESNSLRDRRLGSNARSTLTRNTAGGTDFPTWEREVDADERSPLPVGREGRFVPAWTSEVGARPTGVAALGGVAFVVPLQDGRIRVIDPKGADLASIETGSVISLPPVSAGAVVLVAAGERLVAVGHDGVAWTSLPGGRIVQPPAFAGEGAYVAREGGTLERLAVADGTRTWLATAGAEIAAAPSASGKLVAYGAGGEAVVLDAMTGSEIARLPVGERVDALLVTEDMLFASGLGRSGRAKGVTPVMTGWSLHHHGVDPGRPWRLRVGGECFTPPRAVDEYVMFTCDDGYVRAIERRKGVGGWKTDLPSASTAPPVVSGSRLDFVIPQSRHAVALEAENGAVVGWITLPDEDETFVGPSATAGAITASATSFSRVVGWSWEWMPEDEKKDEKYERPGAEEEQERQRRGISYPIAR
jgi:outer membrane protein assembly factor BamB